jgi:hypothetical protein
MGSDESVQVLTLLKEISVLKQLDSEYEAGLKTQFEQDAHRQRQQRHQRDRGRNQGTCGTEEDQSSLCPTD